MSEKKTYAKLNTKEPTPGVKWSRDVVGPTSDEWHRPANLPEDQPIPDMSAPPVDGSGAPDAVSVPNARAVRQRMERYGITEAEARQDIIEGRERLTALEAAEKRAADAEAKLKKAKK